MEDILAKIGVLLGLEEAAKSTVARNHFIFASFDDQEGFNLVQEEAALP
jgi:hypothetical protein